MVEEKDCFVHRGREGGVRGPDRLLIKVCQSWFFSTGSGLSNQSKLTLFL